MATNSMMVDFQIPRTNQALQVILTDQYIKMDGNIMAYTIVGQKNANYMQRNLMIRMNNSPVC